MINCMPLYLGGPVSIWEQGKLYHVGEEFNYPWVTQSDYFHWHQASFGLFCYAVPFCKDIIQSVFWKQQITNLYHLKRIKYQGQLW